MSSEFGELKNANTNVSVSVMAQRVLQHLSRYRQFYSTVIVDNEIRELKLQFHSIKAQSGINAYNDHKIENINNQKLIYSRIQEILKACQTSFPVAAFSKANEASNTLEKQNENSNTHIKKQIKELRYSNKLLLILKNVLDGKKVDVRHLDFSFKSAMVFMGLLIENPSFLKSIYTHIEELEALINQLRFKLEHSTLFTGVVSLFQNNQDFFRASLENKNFHQFVEACDKKTRKTLTELSGELKTRVSSNATFFEEFDDLSYKEMLASQKTDLVGQRLLQENTSRGYFMQLIKLEDPVQFSIKIEVFLRANPHVAGFLVVKYTDLKKIVKKWKEWMYLENAVKLLASHKIFFTTMDNYDFYSYFISRHPDIDSDALIRFIDDFSQLAGEDLNEFVDFYQVGDTRELMSILKYFLQKHENVFDLIIQNQQDLQQWFSQWEMLFEGAIKKSAVVENNNNIQEEEIEDVSPSVTSQHVQKPGPMSQNNVVPKPESDAQSLRNIVAFMIEYKNFFSYIFDASAYSNFVRSRDPGFNFGTLEDILEALEKLINDSSMIKTVASKDTNLICFIKLLQVTDIDKLETILEKFLGGENRGILNFLVATQEILQAYAKEWETWFNVTYSSQTASKAFENKATASPIQQLASSMSKMFDARAIQERAELAGLCDPPIRVEQNDTKSASETSVSQMTQARN